MRCSSIIAATVLLAGAAVSAQYAGADHHELAAREAAAAEWYARAAEEELAARHEAAWAARDYDDELLARAYMAAHDEELAARAAPKKAAKSKSKASQHTFGWSGKGYKGGEQAHREFATACNAAAKRHDSNIYSLVVRDAGREKSRAYCYTFKGPQGQLHDHSAEIAGQLTWKKL